MGEEVFPVNAPRFGAIFIQGAGTKLCPNRLCPARQNEICSLAFDRPSTWRCQLKGYVMDEKDDLIYHSMLGIMRSIIALRDMHNAMLDPNARADKEDDFNTAMNATLDRLTQFSELIGHD